MRDEIAPLVAELAGDAPASALSALTELAKKKDARLAIDALLPDRTEIIALLSQEAPKARKNAARLLGALGHPEDGAALAAALSSETTLFVIPSLLLALGSLGGPEAVKALSAYTPPAPKDETETKHCGEIATALSKARGALPSDKPLPVYTPARPVVVLLTAPEGFAGTLLEELTGLGFSPRYDPRGALVSTADLPGLFQARCFSELLLPLGTNVPFDPASIARLARGALTLPYRVELRTEPSSDFPRRQFLSALVAALGGENNPARYALELRVERHGDVCDLFIKPSLTDPRFAYRKGAIPASIAPALAACLVLSFCKKRKNQRKMTSGQDEIAAPNDILPSSPCAAPPNERKNQRKMTSGQDVTAAPMVSASCSPCAALPSERKNQRKMTSGQDEIAAPADAVSVAPLTVLDPCCGSGTLLIELEMRLALENIPCRALLGVDVAESALSIARENAAAAGSVAQFIRKDALGFAPREPFDLIVSNLPFGNRVGTHESNERLYRGLVARLPVLLKSDGMALLYTMEYRLLRDCLKGVPGLTLLAQRRTEAGGLLPWVFILQRTDVPA